MCISSSDLIERNAGDGLRSYYAHIGNTLISILCLVLLSLLLTVQSKEVHTVYRNLQFFV